MQAGECRDQTTSAAYRSQVLKDNAVSWWLVSTVVTNYFMGSCSSNFHERRYMTVSTGITYVKTYLTCSLLVT